ncbi:MAG TPA: hypothetical protein PK199_05370 [Bacteroidales bacterium]|nr:hypothetical protein [Bacteroidales bacterium]
MSFSKLYTVLLLSLITNITGVCQSIISNTGYEFIGDNREYFSPYGFAQTILASRISQELTFCVDSSHNSFAIGGSYMFIHGAKQFANIPDLQAYYTYQRNKTTFKLGSFPMLRTVFPLALYTDSLYYFRPNMQGALLSFSQSFGGIRWKETGILDWILQENYGANESFVAGISGELWYYSLVSKHMYYYRHHAKDTTGGFKSIEDNGCVLLTVGYVTSDSPIQFSYDIGKLITWQKFRFGNDYYSGGLYTQAKLAYSRLAVQGTYYYGDPTYLPMGDPLYRSGNYGRIDCKITFIDSPGVEGTFGFCTHIIDSDINFSQQLSLKIHVDKIIDK